MRVTKKARDPNCTCKNMRNLEGSVFKRGEQDHFRCAHCMRIKYPSKSNVVGLSNHPTARLFRGEIVGGTQHTLV